MSTASHIEWTDATWNPVTGCTRVSAGCDHCYAVAMTHRQESMGHAEYAGLTVLNGRGDRHFNGVVRCHEDRLEIPLRWRKPRRVFVNSMSDLFHPSVPFTFVDRVFAVMSLTVRHTFQVLTKRPDRMAEYLNENDGLTTPLRVAVAMGSVGADHDSVVGGRYALSNEREDHWPIPNVWLGTSVEDQAAAGERIPHLTRCPASVRFLSCEPLIGPLGLSSMTVDIPWMGGESRGGRDYTSVMSLLDWVIVGGESGPGARPCNVTWMEKIINQAHSAGVPVFVKQLGTSPIGIPIDMVMDRKGADPNEWPSYLRIREFPECAAAC